MDDKQGCMVLPIMVCTLRELMARTREHACFRIDEREHQLRVAHEIASGMAYLHACTPRVVHADLKPENVMLDESGRAVVIDFGLAGVKLCTQSIYDLGQELGTPSYMAPECFDVGRFGRKPTHYIDIYSFGVLLLELWSGTTSWRGYDDAAIKKDVVRGKRPLLPDSVPSSLRDLIVMCWAAEPDARPEFTFARAMLESMRQVCCNLLPQPSLIFHLRHLQKLTPKLSKTGKQQGSFI